MGHANAMTRHAMSSFDVMEPCHAMQCHASYAMQFAMRMLRVLQITPCHHAMPCHAMPCHAMPFRLETLSMRQYRVSGFRVVSRPDICGWDASPLQGAVPIPGAKDMAQAKENLGALGWRLRWAALSA